MEWQPIETAPRDQTEVIVFAPDETPSVFTAKLISNEWCYSVAGRYAPEDDFYGDKPIRATLWMSLPEAPNP